MTGLVLAAMLMAGSGAAAQSPGDDAARRAPEGGRPLQLAQVTVRERVIIRVQTLAPIPKRAARSAPAKPARPPKWKERKADRCIAVSALASGAATRDDSVDLLLRNGSRLRAKLESHCPALDFYSGFYLKPNPDGKVCADRDMIFSRSGGQCEITAFRKLVPDP